jgi:SsrA-binding protein
MKIIVTNKKAYFDYEIKETLEAGISLTGDEVKSIRAKQVSLGDAFVTVYRGEMNLINCYIAPYSHSYIKQDTTRRTRKLLLRRREINKLIGEVSKKGYTLIPTKLYFNKRGYIKLEFGAAKHKKTVDKKKKLKERDIQREASREIKQRIQ